MAGTGLSEPGMLEPEWSDVKARVNPDAALKLSTLRNAKGREFEAVAMIDLRDGRIPFFKADTQDKIDEARRLFYVGITRTRRYLLYGTDTTHCRNRPSPFLKAGTGLGLCWNY